MGLQITRDTFTEDEFARFSERLRDQLDVLGALAARPGFGEGPATVGAELELFLVDPAGLPLPANREVLARTVDPRFTVEIDRFNLEFNACPYPLAGRPFTALADELAGALSEITRAAREQGRRAPGREAPLPRGCAGAAAIEQPQVVAFAVRVHAKQTGAVVRGGPAAAGAHVVPGRRPEDFHAPEDQGGAPSGATRTGGDWRLALGERDAGVPPDPDRATHDPACDGPGWTRQVIDIETSRDLASARVSWGEGASKETAHDSRCARAGSTMSR